MEEAEGKSGTHSLAQLVHPSIRWKERFFATLSLSAEYGFFPNPLQNIACRKDLRLRRGILLISPTVLLPPFSCQIKEMGANWNSFSFLGGCDYDVTSHDQAPKFYETFCL